MVLDASILLILHTYQDESIEVYIDFYNSITLTCLCLVSFKTNNMTIQDILQKEELDTKDIATLLQTEGDEQKLLFAKAQEVQLEYVGRKVFYRGLVEFSNVCAKNCFYCGIRKDNKEVVRYHLEDKQVLEAARFAYENNYASIVLQAGERSDDFLWIGWIVY